MRKRIMRGKKIEAKDKREEPLLYSSDTIRSPLFKLYIAIF